VKTDAELKQLAKDVWDGKVFTDCHIEEMPDEIFIGTLKMIFMPLALFGKEDYEDFQKQKPGMVYEYLDQAGPRSINGYPSFFSFQFLTEEELPKFHAFYVEVRDARESV
jgi:hypothetical protein